MLSRHFTVRLLTCCLTLCSVLCLGWPSTVGPQLLPPAGAGSGDLEVWIGQSKRTIHSQQREDQTYYPLKDFAEIVGLELRESGDVLTVQGPRGQLQLVNGRTLAQFEVEYILLSAPVWKREAQDWYVSEDFLFKALPLVINRTLDKVSERRYRMEGLAENQVQVRINNYPDHVRVVFQSSQKAPIRVREFETYIQVAFDTFLVQPEFPAIPPDRRLVSSVDFDSSNGYGTFRVQKGDLYYNFREFTLTDPDRKVLDIYGPPAMSTVRPGYQPVSPERAIVDGSTSSLQPEMVRENPVPSGQGRRNLITIDPGHGGEDFGVNSPQGIAEKTLTLRIARRMGSLLTAKGHQGLLTRTRDVDLAVEQRSSVGNYNSSQVYLSIHVGGSPSPQTRGPVVYLHKDLQDKEPLVMETNQEAAAFFPRRLPASLRLRVDHSDDLVPWNQGQQKYLDLSRELAELLQGELNLLWGIENRVAEIPLAVLAPVTAPAVLIEVGFLTNAEDHQKLSSREFQDQIAHRITSALLTFLVRNPAEQD